MAARYTSDQVIEALRQTHGMVYKAAELLGCAPNTVYNYSRKYAKVRETLEMERGLFVDTAEQKLFDAVDRGESWAVTLALKTRGKDRGYTERQEITGADGGSVALAVGPDFTGMDDEHVREYLRRLAKVAADVAGQ